MKKRLAFAAGVIIIISLFLSLFSGCKHEQREALNRLDSTKITLGRFLFYDRRLSVNNTRSCGTCHNPQFAFTDGYKRSLGVYADLHQRNTQPLFNLAYLKYFTAADSTLHSPEQQMNNPLFNLHPAEMGVKGNEEKILRRIGSDKDYRQMFAKANAAITWPNIMQFISMFIGRFALRQVLKRR
jgi:cytochrome c peroxidase